MEPESSVSDWLWELKEKILTERLNKDETAPNLLLCFKGFVHFALSAAKDDTKVSLLQGDYSTVGETASGRSRTGGGCVAEFVSPTVVELRAVAGAPNPFSYGGICNFGEVGTLTLEIVQEEEEENDSEHQQKKQKTTGKGAAVYPRLKGTLVYKDNLDTRSYLFTGFHPEDTEGREERLLFTRKDYFACERSKVERKLKQRRERRERWERLMPSSMVLEPGASEDEELDFYPSDREYLAEFRPPGFSEDEMEELCDPNDKLDWSGRPGHRCTICNRRSEGVGPRRGFNYEDDYCGGCVS